MATYLITGGAGFIGSHLAHYLIEKGHKVRILDDLSAGDTNYLPDSSNITFIEGDVRKKEEVRRGFKGIDGCFHLAAVTSVDECTLHWHNAHTVNVGGAIHVFETAANQGVPVVYASSAAVYGKAGTEALTEKAEICPTNAYGIDKYSCELQARIGKEIHGLQVTGLRFFNVYGPRQSAKSAYASAIPAFLKRLNKGEDLNVTGDGSQCRDFIYVSDIVRALTIAMEQPKHDSRVYNICTGNAISILELAERLIKLTGVDADINFVEARKGDIMYSVGDPSKAKEELKFEAKIRPNEGLQHLVEEQID